MVPFHIRFFFGFQLIRPNIRIQVSSSSSSSVSWRFRYLGYQDSVIWRSLVLGLGLRFRVPSSSSSSSTPFPKWELSWVGGVSSVIEMAKLHQEQSSFSKLGRLWERERERELRVGVEVVVRENTRVHNLYQSWSLLHLVIYSIREEKRKF